MWLCTKNKLDEMASGGCNAGPDAGANGSTAGGGMDVDVAEFECREQCYGEMTDKAVTTGYRVALVVLLQLSCRSLCDPHRIKAVTVLPSTATLQPVQCTHLQLCYFCWAHSNHANTNLIYLCSVIRYSYMHTDTSSIQLNTPVQTVTRPQSAILR